MAPKKNPKKSSLFDPATFSAFGYLDPKLVIFSDAPNQDVLLRELVDLLDRQNKLKDKNAFYRAILERETIVSTGIGMGVAIPHAKLPGYDTFFIAIAIHRKGLDWKAIDTLPVRLIFMIGGPDDHQAEYLQILSRLTLAIKDGERRKKMLQLDSQEEIINLFREI